jgi:tetratricopeptide (TPR) repeat protein
MAKRLTGLFIAGFVLLCLASIVLYNVPPIHERLSPRLAGLRVQAWRYFNPPEEVVFVPEEQIDAIVQATLSALTPSPTTDSAETPIEAVDPIEPGPTITPTPSPTATPLPTAIPNQVSLTGIVHEYQSFNNCGPANLSMALSYWGWTGDQRDTAAFLRPGEYDKNVNPAEMQAFIEEQTDLQVMLRVGGDLEMIKRFLAAGYPVVIEKGYDPPDDDWMGHYQTFNAYDDETGQFMAQDSLIMPDFPVPYQVVEERWRDFNHVYLVIYPPDRESEVLSILGSQADQTYNYEYAVDLARSEIESLSGREQYFAWFNLGSNLLSLEDYVGAAQAFDNAFALYPTIPNDERPWRVMWYRDDPYEAYYHTERYQDIIDLANTTFFALGEYTLEESFYWRGLAHEALGKMNEAVFDLKKAVELNPRFEPARQELARLGVEIS